MPEGRTALQVNSKSKSKQKRKPGDWEKRKPGRKWWKKWGEKRKKGGSNTHTAEREREIRKKSGKQERKTAGEEGREEVPANPWRYMQAHGKQYMQRVVNTCKYYINFKKYEAASIESERWSISSI